MRERRDAGKRPVGGGARSATNVRIAFLFFGALYLPFHKDYLSAMYGDQRQNDVKVHEKFYNGKKLPIRRDCHRSSY